MAKIKHFFSGITKNTILLAFASLFSDISTEMLYPILPIYLTQLKAGGSIIGLIEGIGQATQNIIQGVSGWLADRIEKRKGIALFGYFFAALAKPLMGMASAWEGVLGGRFLDRFSTGVRSAPRDALIAGSVSKEHRGKAFGLEGIGDNLGAFLGPILAVFLIFFIGVTLRHIFYWAVIPGLLAFLMILLVKEKTVEVPLKSKLEFNLQEFPKKYWHYLFVTALFGIGNSSNAFLILQTRAIGVSLFTTILIYAGFNLVAAIISYPAGYLSDQFGKKNILLVGFLIFFIVYAGFALSQNIFLIGILFIFYGLFQGIFRSAGKALALEFVPDRLHASGIGWYSATIGLLQLFASIIGGLLWDHIGHQAVFVYGAVFSVIGTLMLYFVL